MPVPALRLLLTEQEFALPAPEKTFETSPYGRPEAVSLEHQLLRNYRGKFNKLWYDIRRTLDDLNEFTMLQYTKASDFWTPYMDSLDKVEDKLREAQGTVSRMKTLMAQMGVEAPPPDQGNI